MNPQSYGYPKFGSSIQYPSDNRVMMLLFARWFIVHFGTPEYNANGYDGKWWKDTLEHFMDNVYPNMKQNGSVQSTIDFLK